MKNGTNFITYIRTQVGELFKNTKKTKLIKYGVIALAVILVIVILLSELNKTSYSVLYSDMDASDAGEVIEVLNSMGVENKSEGAGTILVPSDQADSLRMELAAQGYPNSGLNYDIFQQASGLGTTDMEKQTYLQFQLQENLRQTIIKLNGVADATVTISLKDESAYVLSGDESKASAAIMLELDTKGKLEQSQVKAIAELVSKSVPGGVEMEDIRIIDTEMNLYDLSSEDGYANVGSHAQLQNQTRDSLQEQVINLLNPIFGTGNVLAEVNVVLDFDKTTTEKIEFSPPIEGETEGIATEIAELAENIDNYNGDTAEGTTGQDSNGGSTSYVETTGDGNSVYSKVTKDVSMEVNQTKTLIEKEQGQIKDLSVSVIINNVDQSEDYTKEVTNVVANAVGVDPTRITVEYMPFTQADNLEVASAFDKQKELVNSSNTWDLIKIIIIVLGGIIVLLILLRTFGGKIKRSKQDYEGFEAVVGDVDDVNSIDEVTDIDGERHMTKDQRNRSDIEKYIGKNPESVAQLLRNWLSDED